MRNKGFTLIELLAVIVILAIIALIATPIVLNIIKDARDSSNERSVELYAKAIEQGIARTLLTQEVPSGQYESTTDGKTISKGSVTIKVDYSGSNVKCDIINILKNGNVYVGECHIGDNIIKHVEKWGDANADGKLDIIDSIKILNYLNGTTTIDQEHLLAADVNVDNVVNELDACTIAEYLAGVVTSLPYFGDIDNCFYNE